MHSNCKWDKNLNANGLYAHNAFIETGFSYGKEAKDTWLSCQGYTYESIPAETTAAVLKTRERESRQSDKLTFFVKLHRMRFLVTNICSVDLLCASPS